MYTKKGFFFNHGDILNIFPFFTSFHRRYHIVGFLKKLQLYPRIKDPNYAYINLVLLLLKSLIDYNQLTDFFYTNYWFIFTRISLGLLARICFILSYNAFSSCTNISILAWEYSSILAPNFNSSMLAYPIVAK